MTFAKASRKEALSITLSRDKCTGDFLRENNDACLLLTDGFCNEDKSDLTAFLRDNSSSKLRIVLVGADSRVVNGKLFFPENLIATDQKKFIFSSLEVYTAIESFNF